MFRIKNSTFKFLGFRAWCGTISCCCTRSNYTPCDCPDRVKVHRLSMTSSFTYMYIPYFLEYIPWKLFLLAVSVLWVLFKGGNYSRADTI